MCSAKRLCGSHRSFVALRNHPTRQRSAWRSDFKGRRSKHGNKVSSVLKHKGHDVVTVTPEQTIASVVKVLTQNRIGAVPVINQKGQLMGISPSATSSAR